MSKAKSKSALATGCGQEGERWSPPATGLVLGTHLLELLVVLGHGTHHRRRQRVGQVELLARLLHNLGKGCIYAAENINS